MMRHARRAATHACSRNQFVLYRPLSFALEFNAPDKMTFGQFVQVDPCGEPTEVLCTLNRLAKLSKQPHYQREQQLAMVDAWFIALSSQLGHSHWTPADLWGVLHALSKQQQASFTPSMQAAVDAACAAIVYQALYPPTAATYNTPGSFLAAHLRHCAVHVLLCVLREVAAVLQECMQHWDTHASLSQVDRMLYERSLHRCCNMVADLLSELCSRRPSVLRRAWLPMLDCAQSVFRAARAGFPVASNAMEQAINMCIFASQASLQLRWPQAAPPQHLVRVVTTLSEAACLQGTANPHLQHAGAADSRQPAKRVAAIRPNEIVAGSINSTLALPSVQPAARQVLTDAVVQHGRALRTRFTLSHTPPNPESDLTNCLALPLIRTPSGQVLASYAAHVHSELRSTAFPRLALRHALRQLAGDSSGCQRSALDWGALAAANAGALKCFGEAGIRLPPNEGLLNSVQQFLQVGFAANEVFGEGALLWPPPASREEVDLCWHSLSVASESLFDAYCTAASLGGISDGLRPASLASTSIQQVWAYPAVATCSLVVRALCDSKARGLDVQQQAPLRSPLGGPAGRNTIRERLQEIPSALVDGSSVYAQGWQSVAGRSRAIASRLDALAS